MARSYGVTADQITVTAGTAIGNMQNMIYNPAVPWGTPSIYDIIVSCGVTPADIGFTWAIRRTTTAAPTAGTAIVAQPCDVQSPAALTLAMVGPSIATATIVAAPYVMTFCVNQRVTWRWCAVPGGEIMVSRVTLCGAGLAIIAASGAVPACSSTIFFQE